jgi:hypothetical protein
MTPLDIGPTSAYLRRAPRSLQQACQETYTARGKEPPCGDCGVADICCNSPDRKGDAPVPAP